MKVSSKNEDTRIQLLPEVVANQIAAGEVVERPASVVKELVENAIDAGATEIIVDIQNGGRTLRISDNGAGIAPDQVQLAFRRFATSKIRKEEDLWTLSTMGFRGEALASIASIAKVQLTTRQRDSAQGTKVTVHGSVVMGVEPVGCSYGTTISVEDLFYNTPARLKFLKSDSTEINHINDLMQAFALCYNHIAFSVISKSREVLRTHGANSSIEDVARQVFGKDVSDNLVPINFEGRYGTVTGAVSNQMYSRSDKNKQIFFVNNRWVKVPFLTKMLDEIYSDLLPSHRHPVAVLKVDIPPNEIDVNVHPTKKEVRFHSYSSVYETVYKAIIGSLYPVISLQEPEQADNNTETQPEIKDFPASDFELPRTVQPAYPVKRGDNNFGSRNVNYQAAMAGRYPVTPKEGTYQVQQFSFYDELRNYKTQEERKEDLQSIKPIGVIYNIYIMGYLGSDLCFIDQHLAHERYIYEQLELDIKSTQELLTPPMIQFTDAEWDSFRENQQIFEQHGYEIQEFGNKTIILRAIPSVLEISEAETVFRQVLTELINEESRKKALDKFVEIKKTIACKAAIKAGKYLDLEEAKILIKNWSKTKQPYTCPHGRPAIYRLPKSEIDKHFNRTW